MIFLLVTGTLAATRATVPMRESVGSAALAAQSCESLMSLKLPDTVIALAQRVPSGTFAPPRPFSAAGPRGGVTVIAAGDIPEFCRVGGIITPSKDSQIKFEVWLPTTDWNGKFIAMGNAGFAGTILYELMGPPLSRHYAVATTDGGHEGAGLDASFAVGHPEKLIDFAYRAVHETTVKAKQIVEAYFGRAPKFSYWDGCSCGGVQGFSEAQRYPADYDGIIAGAPVISLTHLTATAVWRLRTIEETPGGLVPPAKLALLHQAVLDACDARDGLKDGLLQDPRRCDFDPGVLECKSDKDTDCLTRAQVSVVRKFYAPLVNPRTNAPVFPGLERGGEAIWGDMVASNRYGTGQWLRDAVFQDPNWDYRKFDFDSGITAADRLDDGLMTPNRIPQEFFRRGGKLLHYHGWSDPGVSPRSSVEYYEHVRASMGGDSRTQQSYRLFMVPGMAHCFNGDGPNTFDPIDAIEHWVEHGQAPDRIIAAHWMAGKIDRTRPLCPYPQVAVYKGTGSVDEAANFVCKPQ